MNVYNYDYDRTIRFDQMLLSLKISCQTADVAERTDELKYKLKLLNEKCEK